MLGHGLTGQNGVIELPGGLDEAIRKFFAAQDIASGKIVSTTFGNTAE